MERTNQVLGLIANVGVVIGLILLVYELKQARDVSVFEAVQVNREHRIQMFTDIRDSEHYAPILAKLRNNQELTEEETIRWDSHLSVVWAITYSEWVQRDIGLIDNYSQVNFSARMALGTPGSTRFWENVGVNIYPPNFVDFIESQRRSDDA